MVHDTELNAIASALSEQPTSLELAWRYWNALGGGRSGRYVVLAFRAAALAGVEGVAAFAQAYAELHAVSGEGPRQAFVDRDLRHALSQALPLLTINDRQRVEWVLSCVS